MQGCIPGFVLVFVLVSGSFRLVHTEAQKVHYRSYSQRVRRDKRKLEKGWEIDENQNLNLARLPIPPRGQPNKQYVTNELRSGTCVCASFCARVSS